MTRVTKSNLIQLCLLASVFALCLGSYLFGCYRTARVSLTNRSTAELAVNGAYLVLLDERSKAEARKQVVQQLNNILQECDRPVALSSFKSFLYLAFLGSRLNTSFLQDQSLFLTEYLKDHPHDGFTPDSMALLDKFSKERSEMLWR